MWHFVRAPTLFSGGRGVGVAATVATPSTWTSGFHETRHALLPPVNACALQGIALYRKNEKMEGVYLV